MTQPQLAIWQIPGTTPMADGPGRSEQDVNDWTRLTARIAALGTAQGWSKAEVSRRSGVPEGTFSQWFSGVYKGRLDQTNNRIRTWLDTVEEMEAMSAAIPSSPDFVMTRTAREITETLRFAQALPDMAVVTIAAGMGKTRTARNYCETNAHAHMVTMSPHTKTVHGMLVEMAAALNVTQHNPAKLHRSIGERLQRNGRRTLLIVDEAQNLVDTAVDQLRSLLDLNECGVVLMGNDEIYNRFKGSREGPSYAQIKRRIGKRLRLQHPYPEDIAALLDAWNVVDAGSRKLLTGIGNKPGALGQIDKTLKLATFVAANEDLMPTERHIREAWSKRAVED